MNEEAIKHAFDLFVRDGYNGDINKFQKLLATNPRALEYSFKLFEKDGYKDGPEKYKLLMGLNQVPYAPQKSSIQSETATTTEPAKTEPTATIATETAPAKTEVVAETKVAAEPMAKAEPQITVKEVEAPVKEEPKKELPVSTGLMPVTEKTEVKAVETPSDKMVIKSEKKGKDKVAPEPIKIEPIKVETKGGQIQVEVPTFAIPEPKKKYKPYGEKGPDVYYSEDFDQFIIKEGNERTVVSKGSPKYAEIETKLAQASSATKEGKGKCDTPPFIGCSPTKTALNEFLYYKGDAEISGYRSTDEGGLIEQLDDRKKTVENKGESLWSIYNSKNPNEGIGDIYYANEEPPKSDRFIVYKPYGNDKTLIYDKESGAILKQLDGKAPIIDAQKESSPVYDTKGNIIKEQRNAKDTWRNYSKNNPNDGLTVWQGFEIDHPEYKELKSIIEGIDYKKAKGGTTAPKASTVPTLEPWQQPMQVKEVTEQPKMEVKEVTKEEPKMVIKSEKKTEEVNQKTPTFSKPIIINGAKFDDDMNLMRTFRPSRFEEYKELSKLAKPVDKSLDEIAQSFSKHFESIQLDRNISLSFPDPPNAKKKSVVTQNTENIFEDKIDNKNVYSYYDEKNKKWYIYNKEKDENNWNEVTSPQIKTVLNTKYKNNSGEIDKSKIFKTEEAEADKIIKIKEYYYYNKYLPTLIENWDNLKENQKESIKKDLNVLLMKRLSRDMYHKEKYKEQINDIKERIKRNETVDEIDMNILKFGNPDERYDKFWEYVVEKTGAGDEEVKELIKKYKK